MSDISFSLDDLESLDQTRLGPRVLLLVVWAFAVWAIHSGWPATLWGDSATYPTLHTGCTTAWVLLNSYILFCWTSMFHEAAHQVLGHSKSMSISHGRFIGMVLLVPYTVYRETHIRHHAYLNKPNDWELWPYSDPQASLTFRRIFVWIDVIFGAFTASLIYNRIFFHPELPLKGPVRKIIWGELLGMFVLWSVVLGIVGYFNDWTNFFLAWCVPHLLAGSLQSVRKLTEHLGMSSYDPLLGTRTVIAQSWLTRLASYFNFDIFVHGPHHRHPRDLHHDLLGRMQQYVENNPDTRYPLYPSYTRALWAMLPSLRSPGSGMNAGAARPAEEVPLVDFPEDVMRENSMCEVPDTRDISLPA